jgi:hypothetical protein
LVLANYISAGIRGHRGVTAPLTIQEAKLIQIILKALHALKCCVPTIRLSSGDSRVSKPISRAGMAREFDITGDFVKPYLGGFLTELFKEKR